MKLWGDQSQQTSWHAEDSSISIYSWHPKDYLPSLPPNHCQNRHMLWTKTYHEIHHVQQQAWWLKGDQWKGDGQRRQKKEEVSGAMKLRSCPGLIPCRPYPKLKLSHPHTSATSSRLGSCVKDGLIGTTNHNPNLLLVLWEDQHPSYTHKYSLPGYLFVC